MIWSVYIQIVVIHREENNCNLYFKPEVIYASFGMGRKVYAGDPGH